MSYWLDEIKKHLNVYPAVGCVRVVVFGCCSTLAKALYSRCEQMYREGED